MSEFEQAISASGITWTLEVLASKLNMSVKEILQRLVENLPASVETKSGPLTVEDCLEMLTWHPGDPTTETPGFIESLEEWGGSHGSYD